MPSRTTSFAVSAEPEKAVDHTLWLIPAQKHHGILRRFTGVDNYRQIQFFCQLQLFLKYALLDVVRAIVVVMIIQPNFTNGYDLVLRRHAPQFLQIPVCDEIGVAGMDADCGIAKRIVFRQPDGFLRPFEITAHVDDGAHTVCMNVLKHLVLVGFKRVVVVMSMGIENVLINVLFQNRPLFKLQIESCKLQMVENKI